MMELHPSIKRIYNKIQIKCSKGCGAVCYLKDIFVHELQCSDVRCVNADRCGHRALCNIEGYDCHNEKCAIYTIVKDTGHIDDAELLLLLTGLKNRSAFNNKQIHTYCYWDNIRIPPEMEVSKDLKSVKNTSNTKGFLSCFSKVGFCKNTHLVEIEIKTKSNKPCKAGLVASPVCTLNSAFSDQPTGFAFYSVGQLRHNDSAKGLKYGKRITDETFNIGILYNGEQNSITFLINGISHGTAFEGDELAGLTFYPAVALREGATATFTNAISEFKE